MPKLPTYPVAHGGGADGLGHDHARARPADARDRRLPDGRRTPPRERRQQQRDRQRPGRASATLASDTAVLRRAAHTRRWGQHRRRCRSPRKRRGRGEGAQADSSARPLRRRPDRIARPARVRIRNRKPCVLARRRLLGWNVRLLTAGLRDSVTRGRAGWDSRTALHRAQGGRSPGDTGPTSTVHARCADSRGPRRRSHPRRAGRPS